MDWDHAVKAGIDLPKNGKRDVDFALDEARHRGWRQFVIGGRGPVLGMQYFHRGEDCCLPYARCSIFLPT